MLILNTVELCWLELEGTIKKFRNFREKEFLSWPWSVSYAMINCTVGLVIKNI